MSQWQYIRLRPYGNLASVAQRGAKRTPPPPPPRPYTPGTLTTAPPPTTTTATTTLHQWPWNCALLLVSSWHDLFLPLFTSSTLWGRGLHYTASHGVRWCGKYSVLYLDPLMLEKTKRNEKNNSFSGRAEVCLAWKPIRVYLVAVKFSCVNIHTHNTHRMQRLTLYIRDEPCNYDGSCTCMAWWIRERSVSDFPCLGTQQQQQQQQRQKHYELCTGLVNADASLPVGVWVCFFFFIQVHVLCDCCVVMLCGVMPWMMM